MAEEKRQFPTEMVSLPSKGILYSKESPLSSGEVEIKYMTAKEEDILTSQNLIRKGLVIDHLLESLIVNPDINLDEILIGDKNALMIAARVLGYGKKYEFEVNCPQCQEKINEDIDLTQLKDKEIDHSLFKKGVNEFNFELPISKRSVTFKIAAQLDEKNVTAEIKSLKKISGGGQIDPEVTTRMKRAILSVDGETDRAKVNSFVDNEFLSQDSWALREQLTKISPDVNMQYFYTFEACDYEEEMTVPMTVQFFWPSARK